MAWGLQHYLTTKGTNMKNVDIEFLKELPHTDATTEACFLIWSERERARRTTTLKRFRKHAKYHHNVDLDPKSLEILFNRLATAGVGTVERNRKGQVVRFHWAYGMQSIAQAAMGNKVSKLHTFKEARSRIPQLTASISQPVAEVNEAPKPGLVTRFNKDNRVAVYVVKENRTICLHLDEEEVKDFASLMTG
jgi:hypothetical protein